MASEHRPREYPIVNPEHMHAVLRRIVDATTEEARAAAIADARRLLHREAT